MARDILSEALTAAIDAPRLVSEGSGGVDLFYVRVIYSTNRYRVRVLDSETSIEIEACDAGGYGLGENYISLRNPTPALLAAIFSTLV